MSTTLLAALLVQVVSFALLRHRLGRRWLLRPVVLLMLVSTVDLGIEPALLAVPSISAQDVFAIGIRRDFIDRADLLMAIVMLSFTIAYLLTRPEQVAGPGRPVNLAVLTRVLDWRILMAACVLMALATAAGRGYNDGRRAGRTPRWRLAWSPPSSSSSLPWRRWRSCCGMGPGGSCRFRSSSCCCLP